MRSQPPTGSPTTTCYRPWAGVGLQGGLTGCPPRPGEGGHSCPPWPGGQSTYRSAPRQGAWAPSPQTDCSSLPSTPPAPRAVPLRASQLDECPPLPRAPTASHGSPLQQGTGSRAPGPAWQRVSLLDPELKENPEVGHCSSAWTPPSSGPEGPHPISRPQVCRGQKCTRKPRTLHVRTP